MKRLIEGRDYSIHTYITKNQKNNSKLPICPTCSMCENKSLCQNRRNLFTMNKCKDCKNCSDKENCDKFYIYTKYKAELLSLGRNATTGEYIRKQVNANSEEEALQKLKEEYIKICQYGLKEKIYQPNQKSIVTIATEIEDKKLRDRVINENTYKTNLLIIKRCSGFKFSNIPIQNVTKKQIEDYFEDERIKSNSSIKKDYGMLKRTFNYAEKKQYIKTNFFNGIDEIKRPKSIKPIKKVDALTREEQYVLEQYMYANPTKYNNILLLCLYTGMRIGEVLALTTNDIEIFDDTGAIKINKTLTKDKNNNVIVGKTTKTDNGTRKIKLRKDALNVLKEAMKEMKPNKYNAIFLQNNGRFYADGTINGAFKRIAKNAKIRVIGTKKRKTNGKIVNLKLSSVSTHMLRHTYATRCIEAGIPIYVLQKIMGHADIQTTINIYGEIYDYYQQNELDKYDKYMSKTNERLDEKYKENEDNN